MATKQNPRAKALVAAKLFRIVASPTRVSILMLLIKQKEMTVQAIADALAMTHSAVSHQLGLLSAADIVKAQKAGRTMRYRMTGSTPAKALARFITSVA